MTETLAESEKDKKARESAKITEFRANRPGWVASLFVIALALLGTPVAALLPQPAAHVAMLALAAFALAASVVGFFFSVGTGPRILGTIAILIAAGTALVHVSTRGPGGGTLTLFPDWLIDVAQAPALLIVGLLLGLTAAFGKARVDAEDNSDGLRPPKQPDQEEPLDAMFYYLGWWETEFNRTRKVVKGRAAKVTIWTTILTGMVAILGAVSAALSNGPWPNAIAICTTAASATTAVLLAWNEHFHHKDLWIQRSQVLNELQTVRIEYERASREAKTRLSRKRLARKLNKRLTMILGKDVHDWKSIQGGS